MTDEQRFPFEVQLSDGSPARHAVVRMSYGNFIRRVSSKIETDSDGKGILSVPRSRRGSISLKASIEHFDEYGVQWWYESYIGLESPKPEEVDPKTKLAKWSYRFVLKKLNPQKVPGLWLDPFLRLELLRHEGGEELLHDRQEMEELLEAGYPVAASVLSSRVLEALLQIRGGDEGWWREEWGTASLGNILKESALETVVRVKFGDGWVKRLRGMNALRILGAHSKGVKVTMAEASAMALVVNELLHIWLPVDKGGRSAPRE